MPSVKVVNGKQIVVENLGPIERLVSFVSKAVRADVASP